MKRSGIITYGSVEALVSIDCQAKLNSKELVDVQPEDINIGSGELELERAVTA